MGNTEEEIERTLKKLFEDNAEELGIDVIRRFGEYLCTVDRGLVFEMNDGSHINLTIQAYNSQGRRMEDSDD